MLGAKQQLSMDEGVALYPLNWHRSVSIPSALARATDAMGLSTGYAVLGTGGAGGGGVWAGVVAVSAL